MTAAFEVVKGAARIDMGRAHAWISGSYWAAGIPFETFARAVENSLSFGVLETGSGELRAFARVITDRATFAYLCDVIVEQTVRGQGVGKLLMSTIHEDPELVGLRRWMLATRDAHGLYARYGWTPVPDPAILMQIHNPEVYRT